MLCNSLTFNALFGCSPPKRSEGEEEADKNSDCHFKKFSRRDVAHLRVPSLCYSPAQLEIKQRTFVFRQLLLLNVPFDLSKSNC